MARRTQIHVGLEIGTSKVVVLVGEIARGRTLNIVGVGVAPSRGVMKGEVVDYKAACEAARERAAAEAQATSDVRAAAADAAVKAAEIVLTAEAKGAAGEQMVARGIADLKALTH